MWTDLQKHNYHNDIGSWWKINDMPSKGNVIQLTIDGLEHEVEKYLRLSKLNSILKCSYLKNQKSLP